MQVNGYSLAGLRNTDAVDVLRRAIRDPVLHSLSTGARYAVSRPPDTSVAGVDRGPFQMLCVITARRYGVYQQQQTAPLASPALHSSLHTAASAPVDANLNGWAQPHNSQDFVHVDLYVLRSRFSAIQILVLYNTLHKLIVSVYSYEYCCSLIASLHS